MCFADFVNHHTFTLSLVSTILSFGLLIDKPKSLNDTCSLKETEEKKIAMHFMNRSFKFYGMEMPTENWHLIRTTQ